MHYWKVLYFNKVRHFSQGSLISIPIRNIYKEIQKLLCQKVNACDDHLKTLIMAWLNNLMFDSDSAQTTNASSPENMKSDRSYVAPSHSDCLLTINVVTLNLSRINSTVVISTLSCKQHSPKVDFG